MKSKKIFLSIATMTNRSADAVTVSSYGASDEHPMSTRSASDGGRRQNRIWKYAAVLLCLLTLGVGNAWASTTYYANLTISKTGETGKGKVYYATSNSKPSSETSGALKSSGSTTSGTNQTYYWWVDVDPGYNVTLSGKIAAGPATAATLSGSVTCAQSSSSGNGTSYTATANIVAVTVNSVDAASKALAPTKPSIDYPFTVTFATSNLKTIALDLNKSPETADGKFTITSWAQDGNNVVATGKFNGGGSYGGASRNNSTTVSLQSKASDSAAKTCTVTANFPAMAFVSVSADDVYASQGESGKTGSATFKYNYAAEDDFPTTPTLVPTSGTGAFTVTGYTVTPDFSKGETTVTVDYSFDTNNGVGETPATLTLTAVNGDVHTVTVTGHSEAVATNDASVTTTANVTTEYATFAQALAAANATSGATLTLLRNVDLGTITATNNITKAMTIDLNGKELRAAVNATSVGILTITAAVPVTIKDSKTGGKIINEIARNSEIRTIFVNKAGATLTLESGTISCHNTAQYSYGTAAIGGSATNAIAMETHTIQMAAGSVVNIRGGRVEAYGTRTVQAIRQLNDKNNTTTLNITGGEVYAEGPAYVYGIHSVGNVNISGGTVTTYVNDHTTNGNAFYIDSLYRTNKLDNTYILHRYNYGIYLTASSNATAANCYAATLNVTGGTINVTNINRTLSANGTTLYTEHTYGIYAEISATGAGAGKTAPDGTKVQKACAVVDTFENATLNVTHAGVQAYGIQVRGCYNSKTNTTTPLKIKNSTINVTSYQTAYGVYADAYVNWSSTLTNLTGNGGCTYGNVEMTNVTINATTTGGTGAYCAWANATYGTVAKAKAETGSTSAGNATYYGEYAVAGKITVNSGTYTANAATSSAYAIGSSDRAKCVRNVNGVFANRDAVADPQGALSDNTPTSEAYPELNIHGGNFSATTGTSTAVAVKSGGTTLIDGGTFNAFAGTSDAYGLRINSGVTTANGVTFPASATTKAYGVYITGTVSDWSLFAYAGEAILNNCNVTATTRTTTEARAVYIDGATKTYTQASFDAMKAANNSNYQNYGDYAQVGERSIMGRATINGGTYSATAETTTAYGAFLAATKVSTNAIAVASGNLEIHDAKFIVKTNGTTTAIGVYAGGPTIIDGCDITVQPKTGTAKGVHAYDKKTTITNTKFDVKATTEARLFYAEAAIGSTTGWDYHGEFELGEGNECVATATGGNTAHILTLLATKRNIASGTFAGDYANATSALVTGGSYKATATGTTCYAVNLSDKQVQGAVTAAPSCTIEGGKIWALASGGTTGICSTNGVAGNILFKGGVYNVNTTLSKHIPEGYEEFPLPNDRPEYAEGYRYAIEPVGNHGNYVCQIGSTKYKTLEEALQVVKSGQVIYMIANYTMVTPGDYVLPSGATLLIPYKDGTGKGATTAIGNAAATTTSSTTPSLFRKLTFGNGVNLICSGTIETSAQQKADGQYGACVGMPSGAYGQIHMEEGSHISMESGSRLNCWGYITGKGTIEVKKNAAVLEGFQLGDWCGGSNASSLIGNDEKVFPVTHYFYQSIECPITYRPGSRALGSTHIYASSTIAGQDDIALVGTTGSMFLMDDNDVSADTWVMKDYDEATDQCVWTINSGASIGSLTMNIEGEIDMGFFTMPLSYSLKSADYDLPITTNMSVVLNYGAMEIGQNTVFLPGSKLIVNKEGTAVLKGISAVVYDAADWASTTIYRATYSPTWGTTNPRSKTPVDAEFFLHGKVDIRNNGGLYTTASGANIYSTNADAGEVIYTTAAQGNKTNYYLQQGGTTRTALTVNPAKLKNGDGSYASSAGTTLGKTWTYKNDIWDAWSKDGCFFMNAQDKPHAKPAELVELTDKIPDENHLHHDAATGTRNFVWDADCYWWEVVTTPTAEGYYKSLNADNNGDYNYYYYDSAANCWKIKKITVTWNVNGTNTNYSVGYGVKPEWLGATPTKSSSSDNYVWRWDGWTMGSDATVLANNDLPYVTENTTFTAHFYEKYYEYNITFKNDDGTILDSRNWRKGDTPSYEGTPTKNPTADKTYEFNDTWTPDIATVSGSATYVANYTSRPRAYTITFLNYDMSVLGTAEVNYGDSPVEATYKAAIAPSDFNPYKPDNNAYSFVFNGWKLNGADKNGFVQVQGDQAYVAQYEETTKKYRIEFVDDDGETLLHWTQLEYGAMAAYDGPATSGFDKQDVAWNYTFAGWDPATFSEVQGPQTYTATYNKSARPYTITWLNDDGSQIGQTHVAYGSVPTHAAATKEATAQYVYTFNNWTPEPVAVTGDATYTAQFNSTVNKYDITWVDGNGVTLKTEKVEYGQTPAYSGATPTKTATAQYTYVFSSWSPAIIPVDGEATYTATFSQTENKYTVSVAAGANGAVSPASVSEIGCETASADITATPDAGYAFNGWTLPEDVTAADGYTVASNPIRIHAIAADKTITANFVARNDINYTVKHWQQNIADDDYTEVTADQETLKGTTATATAATAKSYTGFTAQPISQETIAGDGTTVVNIYYNRMTYTIAWVNGDGNTVETDEVVKYGAEPSYEGETPTKTATAQYTYTFNNTWSPALAPVTGNATYTAQFIEIPRDLVISDEYPLPATIEVNTTVVKVSGDLDIGEGKFLTTQDLILEASKDASGQIRGNGSLIVTRNVYFDLHLNTAMRHWRAFTVPFEIDLKQHPILADGVSMPLGVQYDIVYYDGAVRAAQGKVPACWHYVEDDVNWILTPGVAYMIVFGRDVNTVRFTKKNDASIRYTGPVSVAENNGASDDVNGGWNGIGNPATYHALLDAGVNECQVHNGEEIGSDGYTPCDMGKFIVGKAVFVQVKSPKSVVVNRATVSDELIKPQAQAPRRTNANASGKNRFDVQIIAEDGKMADRMFLLADEDKEDKYVILQDLAKAGLSTKRAQIWVDRYGTKLCKNTAVLTDGQAEYPLGIFAPAAGDYTIQVAERPDEETTLYLTYDGTAIWNLTYGDYVASLEKGTTNRYGLRLVRNTPQVATGMDEAVVDANGETRKVLINDQVFIIRGENVYTIDGQMVK